jgi:cardiolipin synthase
MQWREQVLMRVSSSPTDYQRRLRLNFELTMWVYDRPFAAQVAAMLEADMAHSRLVERDELAEKSLVFFDTCRIARLMEPVL